MPKNKDVNLDENGDFVFRFKLDVPKKSGAPSSEDAPVDFYRQTLRSLLDILVLTRNSEEVGIDGFKLLIDRSKNIPIFD